MGWVGIADQLQTGDREEEAQSRNVAVFCSKVSISQADQQCPEGMVSLEVQYGTAL